ncbi:MAG: 7-cyano-7-deazaguanine synthase QueC [Halobacteriovoraceae bacterium]|nr:7-cyano-7-deazaguanine synthase QueC [Halobacteriovoraceae bacterium]MCB9095500.1 7-cyano-7-deazaguanine synthase QueC [Halobacteriovoraceae bacterium]
METPIKKDTIVVHSGGMDSSLCLALAIKEYGSPSVLSLSFDYGQRHSNELEASKRLCQKWGVDHYVIPISFLNKITHNSLTHHNIDIIHGDKNTPPNSLVLGRNGLMARIAAIHAQSLGANHIYLGVIELEEANSGYRDCNRRYYDLLEQIFRIDFGNDEFKIHTPLVFMTKKQTMELGHELGVLDLLLENTISCYEGLSKEGCQKCPACLLRNQGILDFANNNPHFTVSYLDKIKNLQA